VLARQHALQWTAEAIGVCALITPWNWPLNQIVCKVAAPTGIIFAEILPCGRIFQLKVSVSHEGFRLLGQRIKALGIPCVVVQEGGYDIATLDENASRFFAGMTA
jgi:hypothetical protein